MTELVFVSAQVPADLLADFKKLAEQTERSVSAEIRRAMRAHVEAHDSKAKAA